MKAVQFPMLSPNAFDRSPGSYIHLFRSLAVNDGEKLSAVLRYEEI